MDISEVVMDCYKQLRMEISGFKKIICSYSKKSSAAHILPELETALIVKDKEAILYGLDVIIEWYNNNISEIRSNQYVTNLEEHIRTHQLLKKIKENLQDYVFEVDEVNDVMKEDDSPIIFLSHKSDDCKYGNALERFIIGLGVKNDQLIYSSHPLHKIPLDANIYEYLRSSIPTTPRSRCRRPPAAS